MGVLLVLLPQEQNVQSLVLIRGSLYDHQPSTIASKSRFIVNRAQTCDQSADVLMQLCLPKELITIVPATI